MSGKQRTLKAKVDDKLDDKVDDKLDQALKDSFPASDPVSFLQPGPMEDSGRPPRVRKAKATRS